MKQLSRQGIILAVVLVGFAGPGRAAEETSPSQGTPAASATVKPAVARPSVIYITDFHLDPAQIEERKRLLGQEGEGPLGQRGGPLGGRLAQRKKKEPEKEGPELVRVLSESILKHLNSEGLRAELLPGVTANYQPDEANGRLQFLTGGATLPKEGWLVTGWFEKVKEGNAAVEATVGMGKGAGSATADVVVTELTGDPAQPFLVMGSGSRAKKMPGGLITKNPYVMAAKFVINKRQGMEKDVKSLGTDVAKSLAQYIKSGATSTNQP